jgi:hypothetical protein
LMLANSYTCLLMYLMVEGAGSSGCLCIGSVRPPSTDAVQAALCRAVRPPTLGVCFTIHTCCLMKQCVKLPVNGSAAAALQQLRDAVASPVAFLECPRRWWYRPCAASFSFAFNACTLACKLSDGPTTL